MSELRDWAKIRTVTIAGETKTLEDMLDWSKNPVEQLEEILKAAQSKALALMDAFFIYRTKVDDGGIADAVAEMEAIEREIRFTHFIQERLKTELFTQNKIVIIPEERLSLTVRRLESFVKSASDDVGDKLLTEIDAIITGEK